MMSQIGKEGEKSSEKALKRKYKKEYVLHQGMKNKGSGEDNIGYDDPLVSLVRESMKEKSTNFVTPTKASGEAQEEEEEISPTILEAAKTLSKVASQSVSKANSTDKGKRYRRRARIANMIHLDKMLAKRVQEEQELSEQQLKRKAKVQKLHNFILKKIGDTIGANWESNTEVVKSLSEERKSNDGFCKKNGWK
ncbi:hypothetical protein Tco_0268952 [Tanacetum coccineum]